MRIQILYLTKVEPVDDIKESGKMKINVHISCDCNYIRRTELVELTLEEYVLCFGITHYPSYKNHDGERFLQKKLEEQGICCFCPSCGRGEAEIREPLFILGASDIEMERIEKLLHKNFLDYVYAGVIGKLGSIERCNPMNSNFFTNNFRKEDGKEKTLNCYPYLVVIECHPDTKINGVPEILARINHHFPGDAGFGKPASEFFEASSLGQLINFLGLKTTQEDRVIAAADHCLQAAYAGLCPGVTAEEVLAMRLPELMKREGVLSKEDAMKGIEEALRILKNPPATVTLGGIRVADIRELGNVPFTIEAGVMTGTSYMAKGDKRFPDKVNLSGTKEVVADFLSGAVIVDSRPTYPNGWAGQNGLFQAYGDPERGFAGAYDKPQS